MEIIIIGAGTVGLHIASVLSQDKHNVILVDHDPKKLQEASLKLDIGVKLGKATDWQLLDNLREGGPDVLAALTQDDETNLATCAIAKQLGYPRTIARVRDKRYLNRTRLDFGRIFSVDHFVSPELLAASDILKYILLPKSTSVESFAHGAVQLRTIVIPDYWKRGDDTLASLNLPHGIMVGLIRRYTAETGRGRSPSFKVIIPHGHDTLFPHDEVTFIGEADVVADIPHFFGIEQKRVNSVVIAGGSLTGRHLASKLTSRGITVRIIEKDFDTCTKLAEELPNCHILHNDATDMGFLSAEKVGHADLMVACTDNDEANILTALLAKEVGCKNAIVMLSTVSYAPLTAKLGLLHVASPRISAANRILSLILSKRVTSVVSMYDNQIEIMEIQISPTSRVVGIPLSELGPLLPKDFLIAMIQNRGRIMIADGSRIISPGDTIIAISTPKHVLELEQIF